MWLLLALSVKWFDRSCGCGVLKFRTRALVVDLSKLLKCFNFIADAVCVDLYKADTPQAWEYGFQLSGKKYNV